MKPPVKTSSRLRGLTWPEAGSWPVVGVFFVLGFLYVWLRIEPALEYEHSAPVFLLSRSFFRPFLTYPGGLVDYAAAFLAQLSRDDRLGALSFTVMGVLIYLAARTLLGKLSGGAPSVAPYGPPLVLLFLRERYDFPSLAIGLGLLLCLGLAMSYLMLPRTTSWRRWAVCWAGAALLFYVAGVWPCLLFAVLCGLHHVVRQRQGLMGLGCAALVLVTPLGWLCLPDTDLAKLFSPWGKEMPGLYLAAVYLCFAVAGVVLTLWPLASPPREHGPQARHKPAKAVPARPTIRRTGTRRVLALSVMLLGWAAVWFGLDRPRKARAQIEYYASRHQHQEVLTAAARLQALDSASEVRLHLALYHTGRLGQDLFSFTNQAGWELMPALKHGLPACRPQSETLFELGQVNLAEHYAHEALEWEGERPDILRLLARVNILKGRPRAARTFLNVLAQVPLQRAWAQSWLRELEANPGLPDNAELARIRSRMVSTDLPHISLPTDSVLRQLLHANRKNQMAFEYLMAHYLLTRQVEKIVEEIGRLNDFAYTEIPRHYEEALLLHQQAKGSAAVDLQGRQIRPATLRRFQEFTAAVRRQAPDTPEGRQALVRDFGDTFWYHYVAGRSAIDQSADRPTEQ
jgi:hypothetical protein